MNLAQLAWDRLRASRTVKETRIERPRVAEWRSSDGRPDATTYYENEDDFRKWLERGRTLHDFFVRNGVSVDARRHVSNGVEEGDYDTKTFRMAISVDDKLDMNADFLNSDVKEIYNELERPGSTPGIEIQKMLKSVGWDELRGTVSRKIDQLQSLPRALDLFGPVANATEYERDTLEMMTPIKLFRAVEVKKRFADHEIIEAQKIPYEEFWRSTDFELKNTLEVLSDTRFVYLHKTGNGAVFCNVVHRKNHKGHAWGGNPYIRINLLLANRGVDAFEMMEKVFHLAKILEMKTIAITARPSRVWYFMQQGFEFRNGGMRIVDVPPTLSREYHDGVSPMLLPVSPDVANMMLAAHRRHWR